MTSSIKTKVSLTIATSAAAMGLFLLAPRAGQSGGPSTHTEVFAQELNRGGSAGRPRFPRGPAKDNTNPCRNGCGTLNPWSVREYEYWQEVTPGDPRFVTTTSTVPASLLRPAPAASTPARRDG